MGPGLSPLGPSRPERRRDDVGGGAHAPGFVLTLPAAATEEDDGYLSASEIAGLKLDAYRTWHAPPSRHRKGAAVLAAVKDKPLRGGRRSGARP
jgi:hypothetical protein